MELVRLLKQRPWGIVGAVLLFVVVVVAIFAPLIAPYSIYELNFHERLQPPGENHVLGTDNLGRDEFSRLVYGARPYVAMAGIVTGFAAVLGLILALITSATKSKKDTWLRLLLTILAGLVVIAILFVGTRLVRWVVPFISPLLEYLMHAGSSLAIVFIIFSLPVSLLLLPAMYHANAMYFTHRSGIGGVIATLLVCFGISIGLAMFIIAPMSYLGIGVPPPNPEWGSMVIGTGRLYLLTAPWIALYPQIAMGVLALGTVLFGVATFEFWLPKIKPNPVKSTNASASGPSTQT